MNARPEFLGVVEAPTSTTSAPISRRRPAYALEIERRLEDLDLKPKPFSRSIGLSPSTVGDILAGRTEQPRYVTIERIAKGLGCTVTDLTRPGRAPFHQAYAYTPERPGLDHQQAAQEIDPLFAGVAAARFLPLDPATWVALAEQCGMQPTWLRSNYISRDRHGVQNGLFIACNTEQPDLEAFLTGWLNSRTKKERRRVTAWLRRREMLRASDRKIRTIECQMASLFDVAFNGEIDDDERCGLHSDAMDKADQIVAIQANTPTAAVANLSIAMTHLDEHGNKIVRHAIGNVLTYLEGLQ